MDFVEPKTATQIKVAKIWSEVLSIGPVGLDDDFFELGGDSFDATRVLTRVKEEFSKPLSFRNLVEAPVLRDFSRLIAV
ncbi:phosphopantetheine-binding protein [Agrobacterium tumefaciens]|uniref:phosphopantetheine-binding protein n=1 Tax=Agrobacterium tumefaciens TaxID=358 RepID=UPI002242CC85|nr:phosphopantetheine-binding protein [Agrobacterium tumefaciens]MCW8060188.1 phosphopantetheine-binding protein [Agrobacterium tumefaciens]